MRTEQLLIVAQRFCETHRVRIVNYSALVAASAAAHARIDGIAIHDNIYQAAASLIDVLTKVEALSGNNKEFASICAKIYLDSQEMA